jgi:arylsulfatase
MMNIDLLPTIANLVGAELPQNTIDGKNVWDLWTGTTTESPQEAYYFYYHTNELHGVRYKNWKLYFPHSYRTLDGKPGGKAGNPAPYSYKKFGKIALYNLENDISETTNVAEQYPEVVAQITSLADQKRLELGDALTQQEGAGTRPPGTVD